MSDAIVELDDLMAAGLEMSGDDIDAAIRKLRQIEPYLAGFLEQSLTVVAGKLSLGNVKSEVVQDAIDECMALLLITFQAQRRATLRLWRDTNVGTPLAQLETL